jgi:hypothetical protein
MSSREISIHYVKHVIHGQYRWEVCVALGICVWEIYATCACDSTMVQTCQHAVLTNLSYRRSFHSGNCNFVADIVFYTTLRLCGRSESPPVFYAHCHLFLTHLKTYTRATSTGTSMRGPTVLASACPLPAPYTATTTAIASSKLLLAAVKLCVQLTL